jgi:adenosylcobinamide-phosphate synthase
VILLAFLVDALWGELPSRWHPVVWMGRYLHAARRRLPPNFVAGMAAWWVGGVLFAGPAWLIQVLLTLALPPLAAVLAAPTLDEKRRLLGWHLVSRDTSRLSPGEVNGAAIESLVENLNDSLVAPLFWFLVGGLPMAALYRFANTADAMWGYRTPELEWFGKWAARADDVLNFIPARLTALLLLGTAALCRLDVRIAWRIWRRDGRSTPSPNAGQPMSVAAGALGVNLSKRGLYSLGGEFSPPGDGDVARALRWTTIGAWVAVLLAQMVQWTL